MKGQAADLKLMLFRNLCEAINMNSRPDQSQFWKLLEPGNWSGSTPPPPPLKGALDCTGLMVGRKPSNPVSSIWKQSDENKKQHCWRRRCVGPCCLQHTCAQMHICIEEGPCPLHWVPLPPTNSGHGLYVRTTRGQSGKRSRKQGIVFILLVHTAKFKSCFWRGKNRELENAPLSLPGHEHSRAPTLGRKESECSRRLWS